MVRVVVAGVLGGFLMFMAGAFCHMVLNLESRHIANAPNDARLRDFLAEQDYPAGMYGYPGLPVGLDKMSAEERSKALTETMDKFKAGPAAYIVIAPKGEDAMGPTQLGGELITDIGAALIAALIVSCLSPSLGRFQRWLLVVLLAPCSWLALTSSFALWYRFPWPFILDGLIAAVIEWAIAGLLIVFIVKSGAVESRK